MQRWTSSSYAVVLLMGLMGFSDAARPSGQTLFLDNNSSTPANNTGRVVVENHHLLHPEAITIEAWVRPTHSVGCQTLVGKGIAVGYWLGLCNGVVRFYTEGSGSAREGNVEVPAGVWSHIAVTFDGDERHYFVNGELDYSQSTPGPLDINTRALGIGGEGSNAFYPNSLFGFSGHLSEVRLWSYPRDLVQIRRAMYEAITQSEPGLIGVWSLDGGAQDRFSRFQSVLAPGAQFSGLNSPPRSHHPVVIPGTIGPINVDGSCSDPGYNSAQRLPTWYRIDDLPGNSRNPLEVYIASNFTYLYVCFPSRVQLNDPAWSVEIDPQNDAGAQLQADDYRFLYWPADGGASTARGRSNEFLNQWQSAANPNGFLAVEQVIEFVADVEFRIPLSIVGTDNPFGLRLGHGYRSNDGARDFNPEWPEGSSSVSPATWLTAVARPTSTLDIDFANPLLDLTFDADSVAADQAMGISARAQDQSGIALIELFVDGVLAASANFPQLEEDARLRHEAVFDLGLHSVHAIAHDNSGLTTRSTTKNFRVQIDGAPPSIRVRVNPPAPLAGQAATITATATDPSGISSIEIRDVLSITSPGVVLCEFASGRPVQTCTLRVSPQAQVNRLRFQARATDGEGLSDSTGDRIVLFGNTGTDSDNDGLSDSFENSLCTNPSDPDTDRDGLSDGWEVEGIRFQGGLVESLPDYGVHPCWKDVLLQLDYETGAAPPSAGTANLINQFRDHGIRVYLELNERPRPTVYAQSHIGAPTAVYQTDNGEFYFDPKRNWAFVYGYQRNLPGRSGATGRFFTVDHHIGAGGYCDSGSRVGEGCRSDAECGTGAQCTAGCSGGERQGMACSSNNECPRPDGSFAACTAPCVTDPEAPGIQCGVLGDLPYRLLHEFGHTVGLGHGGRAGGRLPTSDGGFIQLDNRWDTQNYKPHHLSAMNYGYNSGDLCMEPVPSPIPDGYRPNIIGRLTFAREGLGDLNERALQESSSLFSSRIQARDCSHASSAAVPVFRYSCEFDGTQYQVVSDGIRTLARRPNGASWDFSPPDHPPGIDWNCDGQIENLVESNINGPGSAGARDYWDAWRLENSLRGRAEFGAIPNPELCQISYRVDCRNPSNSCYRWPSSYSQSIPTLASGTTPRDCREAFLTVREGACAAIPASEFGTETCPLVDRDLPVAAALKQGSYGGFDDDAQKGESDEDNQQVTGVTDNPLTPQLPDIEYCDLQDNDEDGVVDEGCTDTDADGVPDVIDNCLEMANADQADQDGDGLGDICQVPEIGKLAGMWNGGSTVNLTWTHNNDVPVIGYAVYRVGTIDPNFVYLGADYPSTLVTEFSDTVTFGDTFTYVVRALNLNAEEGEPQQVEVTVGIDNFLFSDSFE